MYNLARTGLVLGISTLLASAPLQSQTHITLGLRAGPFSAGAHLGPDFSSCHPGSPWLQNYSLEIREYGMYSAMYDYYDLIPYWYPCSSFYDTRIYPISYHSLWRPWTYHTLRIDLAYYLDPWAYYPGHRHFAHLPRYSYGSTHLAVMGPNLRQSGIGYKEAPLNQSSRTAARRRPSEMSRSASPVTETTNNVKRLERPQLGRGGQRSQRRKVRQSDPAPSTQSSPSTVRRSQPRAQTFPTRNPPSPDMTGSPRRQLQAAPRSSPRAARAGRSSREGRN